MRSIVLASHGRLAAGMRDSLEMIAGPQPNVEVLCAYTDEQPDAKSWLEERVSRLAEGDELVIVTDLLGGSVCNEASEFRDRPGVRVLAGMCLALVLSIALGDGLIDEVVSEALASIPTQVLLMSPCEDDGEEDF